MPHDEHDDDESMLSAFDSMAPAIPFPVLRFPENSASAFIRSAEAAALLLSEHALIAPVGDAQHRIHDLIHALCLGDFVTVLKSPLNVALLRSVEGILTDDEIPSERIMHLRLQQLLVAEAEDGTADALGLAQLELMLGGVAALMLFVQLNWTGPVLKDPQEFLSRNFGSVVSAEAFDRLHARALIELRRSEESVYNLTSAPGLLLLARASLVAGVASLTQLQSVWWWSGRCTLAHQSLLDNNALELKEYAERCFATAVRDVPEPVPGNDEGADDQLDPNGALDRACRLLMLVQVLVESAHVDFTFWNYRRMLSSLERAQLVSGLQSTLTGARGVRTKYQIDDKSQLYIDASSSAQVRAAEALVFPWMAEASCNDSIELEKQHQARLDERMELIRKRRRARQLERRKQQIENQSKQPQQAAAPAQAEDESASQPEFVDPPTDEELDVEMPGWRESPAADKNYPRNVPLGDDTLLEAATLRGGSGDRDSEPIEFAPLARVDQAILLARCAEQKTRSPVLDELARVEMFAQCERLLRHPRSWALQASALSLRSALERRERHALMRSVIQMEELSISHRAEFPSASSRVRDVFLARVEPVWQQMRARAAHLRTMNMHRTALQLYEQMHLWTDAVECYVDIGARDQADALLQRLLAEEPNSPAYWCLMGQVWDKEEHFLQSWQLSNQKYAKAARLLGDLLRTRNRVPEAIEYYRKALALNAFFPKVWYNLGCCAMQEQQLDVAAEAFSRVVSFDSEHGEAWNNLAAVHMHQKRLPLAMSALEQGSRLLRDNWKVWDNMLTVAMQLNKYHKGIQALDRICDLSERDIIDSRIMASLSRAVLRHCAEHPESQQWRHMHTLLERVCNKFTTNHEHWRVLAEYVLGMPQDAAKPIDRPQVAAEHMTRACRCLQSVPELDRNAAAFNALADGLNSAVEFYSQHVPQDASRLYFARTEIERALVRAQNSETLRAQCTEAVQSMRDLLKVVNERHAVLQPARPAPAAASNSLSSMMNMWR